VLRHRTPKQGGAGFIQPFSAHAAALNRGGSVGMAAESDRIAGSPIHKAIAHKLIALERFSGHD